MRPVAASSASLPALSRLWSDPHLALGTAALLVVALEYGYDARRSDAWLLLEGAVAALALYQAWREQERLRLPLVLGLAFGFQLGLVLLHLAVGVPGDPDSRAGGVYDRQGEALLDGRYPLSEYPLGAVLFFALEVLVSGGHMREANALLMIPCQLGAVAALWSVRTRLAPWLAVLVAFWPLNDYYWEHRFDLLPAALLAGGLLLALRERWALAGVLLGVGTLVKWSPGVAFVALAVWLLASRRLREAVVHAGAFVGTVAVVYVPFLIWSPSEVLEAYTRQGGRGITPESVWYLLMRPFGLVHVRTHVSFSAGAPGWADALAVAVQALLVGAVLLVAVRVRGRLAAGVAVAALAPATFLLANRIFSPQFLLILFVAWAVAAALVARTRIEQLAVGAGAAGAALANAFVYPFALPYYDVTWVLCSATLFVLAGALTAWLLVAAQRDEPAARSGSPRPAVP